MRLDSISTKMLIFLNQNYSTIKIAFKEYGIYIYAQILKYDIFSDYISISCGVWNPSIDDYIDNYIQMRLNIDFLNEKRLQLKKKTIL